jgi:hypothetical protein
MISVKGGHFDYWPLAPKNVATPLRSEQLCELQAASGVIGVVKQGGWGWLACERTGTRGVA